MQSELLNRSWDLSSENQTKEHFSCLESTLNSFFTYFHLFNFGALASHVLSWFFTLPNLILFVVCCHDFSPPPHITMNWFPCMSKLSLKCCFESSQALQVLLNSSLVSLEIVFHEGVHVLIIYFLIKARDRRLCCCPH